MAVSWGFAGSFLVAGEAAVHLMGAGPGAGGMAGSTAKNAPVLGDYAVTTRCNSRDWSALRHAA